MNIYFLLWALIFGAVIMFIFYLEDRQKMKNKIISIINPKALKIFQKDDFDNAIFKTNINNKVFKIEKDKLDEINKQFNELIERMDTFGWNTFHYKSDYEIRVLGKWDTTKKWIYKYPGD